MRESEELLSSVPVVMVLSEEMKEIRKRECNLYILAEGYIFRHKRSHNSHSIVLLTAKKTWSGTKTERETLSWSPIDKEPWKKDNKEVGSSLPKGDGYIYPPTTIDSDKCGRPYFMRFQPQAPEIQPSYAHRRYPLSPNWRLQVFNRNIFKLLWIHLQHSHYQNEELQLLIV